MAFVQPDVEAERGERVQQLYARQAEAFGYLPNYAPLFSHRPEILDLWAVLQRGLRKQVSPRIFELVTFAAAVALKSSYCTLAHGVKLRDFLTDVEITSLARGDYDGVVDAREAAAMRYAARVAEDATAVTSGDVSAMRANGWTDAEIFDIAGIAAGRAFFSKLVEGLGARPDSAYLNTPSAFRSVLTVGRAIDSD